MNTAAYVDEQIAKLKDSGIPLSEAAWKAALLCVAWAYVFGARGQYCTPGNRRAKDYEAHPTIRTACKNFDGTGSCTGCKWYPDGKRTRFYDCRGFTYWILLMIYGWKLMGSGCTAQWNNAANWKAKGNVADGIPQGVIVCLFYYKKDKKGNRTSTLEHTGLYYNGETCECSNGVQHSKTLNKKWEVWGIPACVENDIPKPEPTPAPTPATETRRTLKRGSKGDDVKECQAYLVKLGYDIGPCGIDGDYGKATAAAVSAFQAANRMEQDGICGPKTWAALDKAIAEAEPAPDPAPDPTPDPVTRRTLKRGSKGDDVKECQAYLVKLGYDIGPCGIDGDYGRATTAAITAFQAASGLKQDGICGPLTWAALDKAAAEADASPC